MTSGAPALPEALPQCPKGHQLKATVVTASLFSGLITATESKKNITGPKQCNGCDQKLLKGTTRHSCQSCKYHLCPSCYGAVGEALQWTDITVTIFRAGQPDVAGCTGVAEDVFQVQTERAATYGALKERLASLYGMPPLMQVLRKDVDSAPLADSEPHGCEEGDVLHLTLQTPAHAILGFDSCARGPTGLDSITAALEGALAAEMNAQRESLEATSYELTFVYSAVEPEKRCKLEIPASLVVSEVIDMVKLEFGAEDLELALEFAGELLARMAPIHSFGLGTGDIIKVMHAPD